MAIGAPLKVGQGIPGNPGGQAKAAPRIRKEGALRGFVTATLKIGGQLVKVEFNYRLIVQALIEAGNISKAAEHCLELVRYGVGFSAEARQALFVQGRELSAQAGNLAGLRPVIDKMAEELTEPAAKVAFLESQGDFLAGHEVNADAAALYDQAAALASPAQTTALLPKRAIVREKLGDQFAQTGDEKAAAKKAYETALELWQKIEDKRKVRDCQLKLVEVVTAEEAIKLYSAAAKLTLECGLGRAEGDKIILRAIYLVSADRQLAIWREYDQAASRLAPHEPSTSTGLPPVIEAAQKIVAIVADFRHTIEVARSWAGNRQQHQKAFNMLWKAGQTADKQLPLIEGDTAAVGVLAELWLLCARQGYATMQRRDSIEAKSVLIAYQRSQQLLISIGKNAEARELQSEIDYIHQRTQHNL
ncbi:MAG TPA: hypothetical protein VMT55_03380 [Candidatus Sulfotelmatobacter sp.]|nr:hypothetical protein [Candidatus Sulfotelmatobacter sp.]